MADTRLLERLTASDLFLLLWEDYGWSTDIGGLAILDGTHPADRSLQLGGHLTRLAVPTVRPISQPGQPELLMAAHPAVHRLSGHPVAFDRASRTSRTA